MSTKNKKRSDLINLFLGLFIVVLLNVISQYVFTRFDLTTEKRYTLAPSTKQMVENLDDLVYFKVYLDGDFPQGAGDFKRLRDETKIMLDEFRAYGGDKIQYEFINPDENPDEKERVKFQKQLYGEGMNPQPIAFTDENGTEMQKLLFPWAVASYHGKDVLVPLMGYSSKPNENQLNNAVEGLEYELTNAIRKLQMKIKPRVAITTGHGEPDTVQLSDFVKGLREYYDVDFVDFHNNLDAFRHFIITDNHDTLISNSYSAVIIDKPDSAFTPRELFILDQFIMYGGKALLLIDPVNTNMDSLAITGMTLGLPRQLGIEELTFRYGARLNSTLVEDLYCGKIELPQGEGAQMQFVPAPWYFSPTILPQENHPIVKNLDRIKFDFLSTVDTVTTSPGIEKTILLKTSEKSFFQRTPTRIGLRMATIPFDERRSEHANEPVAVLLEGTFDSYYKNKFLPDEYKNSPLIGYKNRSIRPSKIIVVGDGDVARNPIYKGQPLPLGLDLMNRMSQEFYANKTFLLNCMNYLCDDKGLLSLRSREVTLRLLDKEKIKAHRLKWQMINTLGPVAVVIFLGFVQFFLRRRKYAEGKELPPIANFIIAGIAILIPMLFIFSISHNWYKAIGFDIPIVLLIFSHRIITYFQSKKN